MSSQSFCGSFGFSFGRQVYGPDAARRDNISDHSMIRSIHTWPIIDNVKHLYGPSCHFFALLAYEPWTSSALLENREETWYKTKLAWILVLILLLLVLLLLLLLCCLCARTRKRQKAEVKDAEVSSSFSQGEGRFSTNSGIVSILCQIPGRPFSDYSYKKWSSSLQH